MATKFKVNPKTDALIVVDCQKGFCPRNGNKPGFGELPVPNGQEVVPEINEELQKPYKGKFASRDAHDDPGEHISEDPDYVTRFPNHCRKGTPGYEYHPDLKIELLTNEFLKGEFTGAFSAFEGINSAGWPLGAILWILGIERVVVCGLATDYCVKATALDAEKLGYEVFVLLRACRGVAPETTTAAIEEMRQAGITIIS